MDRLISEQGVIKVIDSLKANFTCYDSVTLDEVYSHVKAIPSTEPKTGYWIRFKEFENGYYHIKCSECGQYWSIDGHAKIFKHCFNCGAMMVEGQERKKE